MRINIRIFIYLFTLLHSATEVFQILLVGPQKYEEKSPLKNMREDKVYTIRNHSLESITCDDNGTYSCSNGNKKTF